MPYDYLVPIGLSIVVLIGCACHIIKHFPNSASILLVLCVALIPKYAALNIPYYGTEYEDAFVFQADSRSIADHLTEADPFRIQIAEFSLAENRDVLKSYTGHFTTFSGLVGLNNMVFGYSKIRAIELNLLFSCLLFLVLYLTVYVGTNCKVSALVTVLIISSSRIISLFQTSALAETYSSLIGISFLYFLIRFWKNQKTAHLDTMLLIVSLLVCLLTKRENMVLLALLPLIGYRLVTYKSLGWLVVLAVALFSYFIFVKPFSTEFLEASSIKAPTFSLSYFVVQLPAYVGAFLKPQLFGLGFWSLCVLLLVFLRNRELPTAESIVVIGVFLGYLAIYCLHYRSRYFVLSMEMSDFETFRYANNFFYLISLFVGLNLRHVQKNFYPRLDVRKIAWVFAVFFIIAIVPSQVVRTALQTEEFNTRILPLLTANKLIRESDVSEYDPVLVTDIPVVGKMLSSSEFNVFVQEFQREHDYFQYKNGRPIYLLVPKTIAIDHLGSSTPLSVIPLGIDTNYILYRLL
jgi:hypothetical protein